jgi:hypothetical protein
MRWIDETSVGIFALIALTLGLAPFLPEPHVWQKLNMLISGELTRPLDIFDLLLHGAPWLLLSIKLVRMVNKSAPSQ